MKILMGAAALALAVSIPPADAAALKAIPTPLDPAKAYILVEYKRVPNPYSGSPLAPKYLPQMAGLALARYDVEHGDIRGLGKAAANPLPLKASPTEPFQNRPIVKTETSVLFLHEVEPDTYVVQGWANTSFSLGSYRFEAKPGTVVDLGIVSAATDWAVGEQPKPMTAGRLVGIALAGPFAKMPAPVPYRVSFQPRGESDIPVPAGFPRDRVVPVTFENGATFGNYLGGLVNRVDGVNAPHSEGSGGTSPSK
jgi:hypothetical protein